MAIGLTYRNNQIAPGVVHVHGLVVFGSGGVPDPVRTQTPGVDVVRTGTGAYTFTFRDGVTPGITVPVFGHVLATGADDTLLVFSIGEVGVVPGSTGLSVETRDIAGAVQDPIEDAGIVYTIQRVNTTVTVP